MAKHSGYPTSYECIPGHEVIVSQMTTLERLLLWVDLPAERKYFTISLAADESLRPIGCGMKEDGEIHVYLVIIFLA